MELIRVYGRLLYQNFGYTILKMGMGIPSVAPSRVLTICHLPATDPSVFDRSQQSPRRCQFFKQVSANSYIRDQVESPPHKPHHLRPETGGELPTAMNSSQNLRDPLSSYSSTGYLSPVLLIAHSIDQSFPYHLRILCSVLDHNNSLGLPPLSHNAAHSIFQMPSGVYHFQAMGLTCTYSFYFLRENSENDRK